MSSENTRGIGVEMDNTKFDILKSIIADFDIDKPCFDYDGIHKNIINKFINELFDFDQNQIGQILYYADTDLEIGEMNNKLHKLAVIIDMDVDAIRMEDFELMDNTLINVAFFNRIVFLVILSVYRDLTKEFKKEIENNNKLNNFRLRFPHFAKNAEDKIIPASTIHDNYSPKLNYLENCLSQLFKFWFGVRYSNAEFDKLILKK
jgi:hypothetical protein